MKPALFFLLATVVATALGALMAFAMVRHRFRGRSTANVAIFLPMASPEIVLGSSLLALFVSAGFAGQLGFWTVFVAHVMFCLSYVVVTLKARLEGLDPHIEEAAMDLGANRWATFRLVTLPMIAPGLAAAGLLSFAISLDDFVITNFNAGETQTFPLFIYGAARQGVPAQVNVLATMLLLAALALMAANLLVERRRAAAAAVRA
jgi:spermidine/putrescine transport system permease protein